RDSAERVMGCSVGAVKADGYALDSRIDNHPGNILGDQRAVGGQGHAQALVGSVTCQLENVGAIQGLAATQHQDGIRSCSNLIDDAERSASGQVGGRAEFSSRRAAMDAAQIASLGDFPENQPGLILTYR